MDDETGQRLWQHPGSVIRRCRSGRLTQVYSLRNSFTEGGMRTNDCSKILQCLPVDDGCRKFRDHIGRAGTHHLGAEDPVSAVFVNHLDEAALLTGKECFAIGGHGIFYASGIETLVFRIVDRQTD